MTPPGDPFDLGSFGDDSASSSSSSSSASSSSQSATWESSDSSPSIVFGVSHAPIAWVAGSAVAAVVAIILGIVAGTNVAIDWVAWILSGPIAIGLLGVFGLRDTRERAKPFYSSGASTVWAYRAAVVLAFIGVIVAALGIANWMGRL